jgi:hypothetical protein
MSQEGVWREARAAFEAHPIPPIDPDAQAALNRIAAKCLRLSFDETTCDVREEQLSLADLSVLEVFHTRARPARDVEPIVVLSFRARRVVIDGGNRVNVWRASGKPQTRRAIIIEPTDAGYANFLMRTAAGEEDQR